MASSPSRKSATGHQCRFEHHLPSATPAKNPLPEAGGWCNLRKLCPAQDLPGYHFVVSDKLEVFPLMQLLLVLLVLFLIAVLVVLPIWVIAKISGHDGEFDALQRRLRSQEDELRELRATLRSVPATSVFKTAEKPPSPAPVATPVLTEPPPAARLEPAILEPPSPPLVAEMPPAVSQSTVLDQPSSASEPPPLYAGSPLVSPVQGNHTQPQAGPAINWEQFMGAKLFAWLGGLALFLGVAFFVKYSFEHDLIPPQVRVALGFLLGAGLVVGGLKVSIEKYRITAQTLVASGVVSLYAVTFACDSIYHFAFFGPVPTFLVMALITATAFMLAVRLNAQVVAILGILGGFLTPMLISTGHDNPAGLFGYIAILVLGLVAVALHRGWLYLVPLGATGTVLMLVAWGEILPARENRDCDGGVPRFLRVVPRRRRGGAPDRPGFRSLGRTAIALAAVAFCFACYFLGYPEVAAQTGLFFTFVFLTSLFVFVLAWRESLGGLITGAAGICAADHGPLGGRHVCRGTGVGGRICVSCFQRDLLPGLSGRAAAGACSAVGPVGGSGNASCLPGVCIGFCGSGVDGRPPRAPVHLHLRERRLAAGAGMAG